MTDKVHAIEHIVSSPDMFGGLERIAGRRITVLSIIWRLEQGETVEEIAEDAGLTVAQVYAAMSYYHDNRDDIERRAKEQEESVLEELKAMGARRADDV